MNKILAVPEIFGQTTSSMLRRPGKQHWGLAFSQFSELKHRPKPWQSFTLHKQTKKKENLAMADIF